MRPVAAGLVLLLLSSAAIAAEPLPLTGSHGKLACAACHDGTVLADCDRCHKPEANPHPVGVAAFMPIPTGFATDADGRLLCRTCHRLHGGRPEGAYVREVAAGDCTQSRRAFCAACHGKGTKGSNPHLGRNGEARCRFCHSAMPSGAEEARGNIRADVEKLCRFCHDAEAEEHLRNFDLSAPPPKGVPTGRGGGWSCPTCHDPHRSTASIHHLRPDFALHYGRGLEESPHVDLYFACRGCHTTSMAEQIVAPDYRLLYRGDRTLLCLSCHLMERGHHPTGIPLPEPFRKRLDASPLKALLDARGRITCTTCHDTGCAADHQVVTVRHYGGEALKADLCWACHDRGEFAQNDPHTDDPTQCRWCHQFRPAPGREAKKTLLAAPTMVCLLCHDPRPHPGGANHLKVPPEKYRPAAGLPLGLRGEVTCATCHEPHLQSVPLSKRLRANQFRLCGQCHPR